MALLAGHDLGMADAFAMTPNPDKWNNQYYAGVQKTVETQEQPATRVTVAPSGARVEYVRMYRTADESAQRVSGTVAYSYVIP